MIILFNINNDIMASINEINEESNNINEMKIMKYVIKDENEILMIMRNNINNVIIMKMK